MSDNTAIKLSPAPPLVILASLLIWGWQTEYILFAFFMGFALEAPYFIKSRINFTDKDINQIVDLSGFIFFLTIIYVFVNYGAHGIYKVLELLPFAIFLIVLIQRFSAVNAIKTSALFLSIRRLGNDAGDELLYYIDISMPYVFICLLSASPGYKESVLFFLAIALILFWLFYHFRPTHKPIYQWSLAILLALGLAFVTQIGIRNLHSATESFMMTLFDHYGWRSRDPQRAMTAIGQLGRLKLSDRILMRVTSDKKFNTPKYLKELTYGKYEYGIWTNESSEFDTINKTPNKNEWLLHKASRVNQFADVGIYLQDQSIIIPAPNNIQSLYGRDIVQIDRNEFGAIRIDAREGWVNFRMGLDDQVMEQSESINEDLFIYDKYQPAFQRLAIQLDLYSKSPETIINTIKNHFAENYYYSLSQNQRFPKGDYLENFLFESKKGHCEYFATATTLLLREVGIPARYSIGYVMSEYSNWQNSYLIRGRDAHSWVEYYLDGKWHRLDTTPSVWAPLESADRTLLEPIVDFFSWLRYMITSESIEGDADEENFNLAWLLIPLLLYLAWRFSRKEKMKQGKEKNLTINDSLIYGKDSPFFDVIMQLELIHDKRRDGENLSHWIGRILPDSSQLEFMNLIKLHYRYRFNADGNKKLEKQQILKLVNQLNIN
ncbi:MAG: transglutaminase-like domain-containing protein [Pseudomonadota bacterium]